jgi:hypothetical protein
MKPLTLIVAIVTTILLCGAAAFAQVAPTLNGPSANPTSGSTALLSAAITSDGGGAITASGIVYGTTAAPTLATGTVLATDPLVTAGLITVEATGLTAGQTYYFRGYATNGAGTSYTGDATVTTSAVTITAVVLNLAGAWDSPGGWVPPAVAPTGTGVRVRVYGTGFSGGGSSSVVLAKADSPDIVCPNLTWGAGVVTSNWVDLDGVAEGLWSVTVTNGAGQWATLADAVRITPPTLTGVSLAVTPAGSHTLGDTVTLTATPTPVGASGVEYAFSARTYSTTTASYTNTPLREWGGRSYAWTPDTAQPYWLVVTARKDGQEVRAADYYVRIDAGTLTGATLNVTDNLDGTYTLQGSHAGTAPAVEHRFVANIPLAGYVPTRYSAVTMRSYSTDTGYLWQPSAAVRGKTLKLLTYTRLPGSTANLQKASPLVTVAVPNPVVSTAATQPLAPGTPCTFRVQNDNVDVTGAVKWESRRTAPTSSGWTVHTAAGGATQNISFAGVAGVTSTWEVRATWRRMAATTSITVAAAQPILVTGVTAVAGGGTSGDPATPCVNGTGLNGLTHNILAASQWKRWALTGGIANANLWIAFNLGSVRNLATTAIWNYNVGTYTACGLKDINVSFSTDSTNGSNGTWSAPVAAQLLRAPAAVGGVFTGADYTFTVGQTAKWVKFSAVSTYGGTVDTQKVGLAEVQFYAYP